MAHPLNAVAPIAMNIAEGRARPAIPTVGERPCKLSSPTSQSVDGSKPTCSVTIPPRGPQKCRPNCTHIDMDRLYGPYSCDLCQRPSPLGWLYRCSQDKVAHSQYPYGSSRMDQQYTTKKECRGIDAELQPFGLSKSIISQAEAGVYDTAQIQTLKWQKQHLYDSIAAEQRLHVSAGPLFQPPVWSKPFDTVVEGKPRACRFKCCHRCRPYMIDRCFTSFGAVFSDELRPLSLADIKVLPIKSPLIARNLGISSCATAAGPDSPNSDAFTTIERLSDFGPNHSSSEETTPTTATSDSFPYSECSSSSDEKDCYAGQQTEESDRSTSVTAAISSPIDRVFSTPVHFMRRTIRRVGSSVGSSSPTLSTSDSSVSLPTPSTTRTSPMRLSKDEPLEVDRRFGSPRADMPKSYSELTQRGATIPGLDSVSTLLPMASKNSSMDCMSYVGDEIEVDGGVALTEEAIRTHTPDLVTDTATEDEVEHVIAQV